MNGVDLTTVKELLGHKTLNMILRYSHLAPEHKSKAVKVLASAYKELPMLVEEAKIGNKLLLIADECHKVGATKMAQVLTTERAFSLGLSATPERDEGDDESEDSHVR